MIELVKSAINEVVFDRKDHPTVTPTKLLWDETKKMRCLVWKGKGDIEYVEHPRPKITSPSDIILKVTATSICGSDLHLYKGTFLGMQEGHIPGHEFLGLVYEVGSEVKTFKVGQRVIAAFCIACGECDNCNREEYTACERSNPTRTIGLAHGDRATGVYANSHITGEVGGGQAEYVCVAERNCYLVPDELPDDQALYLTDIIPTGYHAALMGDVGPNRVVGVWGLGPIGLMCARWCQILGAKRVIGIDSVPERLALAKTVLQIETIDIEEVKDVPEALDKMLEGKLDVAIDCVGFDFPKTWLHKTQMKIGMETDCPELFTEMFRAVRKFGNISIAGDYYLATNNFPIGAMMEKGLTIRGGQCPVQKYWDRCTNVLRSGTIDPLFLVTHRGTLADVNTVTKNEKQTDRGRVARRQQWTKRMPQHRMPQTTPMCNSKPPEAITLNSVPTRAWKRSRKLLLLLRN
ncbi:alcohol dehydrogenase groES-like domain-containing protein [Ditylenchus destructor]|uniref:Alcohol dehydrogenase groES-like domain-containing protein n=1 Tax=Ditylenchus destructor TaxID=166010 RepID=A0AAD4R4V7_9BILA|nr:alcohol dehydrogenase groES-like domain-containing protein [Ditylenchus destructor]